MFKHLTHKMCVYVSHTGLVQMPTDSDAQLVLKNESFKIKVPSQLFPNNFSLN